MKKILFLLIGVPIINLHAQNYSVDQIPDYLKLNAHAVKRLEELHVIIKSVNKMVVKHKYAITILDEQGDDYAEYANNYSSFESLSNIDGNLFDATGKKLKSVRRSDIADVPVTDGFSLMLDNRIKKHNFHHRQYPYTIEYEDEQEQKGTYFLPYWQPVDGDEYSVQQSRFIVDIPSDNKLRVKQMNLPVSPMITNNKDAITYLWEINNVKAIVSEPYQPPLREILPVVYVGATDFSFGAYSGDMSSWQNLGKFNVALNQGRDQLPAQVQQDIHKLVDGVADKEEKVKKVYQYLQNNTRYISVQLGIGGWQPFDAKYVASNKYGDCKALSNYMVSLLKEVGIKANYVLVTAGRGKKGLNEDFPSPYFNHVITCVPNGKDTIWLECTNQTMPAGYMGSFTGNRKALLIDDDGGHVVNTPAYKASDNRQLRRVNAVVDADGNMTAEVFTHFTGIQQELQHSLIHDATKEERDKYLNKALNLPTYEVDKSVYTESPGRIPAVDEYLHVKAPNYASVSGKRLFIIPNLFNRSGNKLSEDKERQYPIQFTEAFKDIDTVNIQVPAGYTPEAIPRNINIRNQFGSFEISYKVDEHSVEMIRLQTRETNILPASEYPELVKYFDAIYKADHSRIVFVKKSE